MGWCFLLSQKVPAVVIGGSSSESGRKRVRCISNSLKYKPYCVVFSCYLANLTPFFFLPLFYFLNPSSELLFLLLVVVLLLQHALES